MLIFEHKTLEQETVVACMWLCVGLLVTHIDAHSTYHDPHQDPHHYTHGQHPTQTHNVDYEEELSNHVAVQLLGGEEEAKALASKYHLHYIGQVFEDPPVFHLHKPIGRMRRSTDPSSFLQSLSQEPGVEWVNQQWALIRDKRNIPDLQYHMVETQHPSTMYSRVQSSLMKVLDQYEDEDKTSYNYDVWDGEDIAKTLQRRRFQAAILEAIKGPLRNEDQTSHIGRQYSLRGLSFPAKGEMYFNDPAFKDQWYLQNTGQIDGQGYDLNVTWAWQQGFTGRGVVVMVLDDGVQGSNDEINENFAGNVSYSVVHDGRDKRDASPRIDPGFTNSHGTYCAAVIAAIHNNSVCGVGIAYNAKVGGVRIVDGRVTDIQEATALSRHITSVDILSASWGPTDDGTKVEGPAKLATQAFKHGVQKGRDGKGVVYVWASGNGGLEGDNCNLDGYSSSIYTISVSSLTHIGISTFYGEPCASTLAGVYVGGAHTLQEAIESRKQHKDEIHMVVPELDGHCSHNFQGTSAAAPLMAGLVALALDANPSLTWRDMQHLVVMSSCPTPEALQEEGWGTNARNRSFHLRQGFGAVDGGRLVENAMNWKNVGPQRIAIMPIFKGNRIVPEYGWLNISQNLDTSRVPPTQAMTEVEQVVANITLIHPHRGLLSIFIISPSGTTSQVLTHREKDTSRYGFIFWGFNSVHFWGEDPRGEWTVAIKDDSGSKGILKIIEFTIYGM